MVSKVILGEPILHFIQFILHFTVTYSSRTGALTSYSEKENRKYIYYVFNYCLPKLMKDIRTFLQSISPHPNNHSSVFVLFFWVLCMFAFVV